MSGVLPPGRRPKMSFAELPTEIQLQIFHEVREIHDTSTSDIRIMFEISFSSPSHRTNIWVQLRSLEDLSRVSQTCKTVFANATPVLYSNLSLSVPRKWSRLSAIENLLVYPVNALQYTMGLSIIMCPISSRYKDPEFEDGLDQGATSEGGEETQSHIKRPLPSLSDGLNRLVRLLIRKLPEERLTSFQ